ncbi:hypothetical protein IEQ34_016913 [Dendrobium chrysotoxum]|uniref:Uncharacterized protein n=1 Tax=Dendrobium chrysotoxum TaxID=161865 RepID=A0AAV7GGJ3_DENCH|nr:hypothetical protein IEQ34_016913 [Dendrobium chrysotoxum]
MSFLCDITLQKFYCKMEDTYGGSVVICYKLPEAFEYGSANFQVFLFPPYDKENPLTEFNDAGSNDSEPSHIVGVNPMVGAFSFGILMSELLMGEEPYADIYYEAIIDTILSHINFFVKRISYCWSTKPSKRPCFTEIANKLCSMTSSHLQQSQASSS